LSFGGALRLARKSAKLSQGQLAIKSGLSVTHIGMIERGVRKNPQLDTIVKLARALDTTPAELVRALSPTQSPSRGSDAQDKS
jgi:transcriptional regulator with XRE-family HTH domain